MSRKYRQRGYQDDPDRDRDRPRKARGPSPSGPRVPREGPRSPRMMGFQEVMRCAMCGASLPRQFEDIEVDSSCPKCGAGLHTCRNCVFFDTSSRFECTQPIPERVARKDLGNKCTLFEARTRVEKQTTSASDPKPALDPREAFERLFKK